MMQSLTFIFVVLSLGINSLAKSPAGAGPDSHNSRDVSVCILASETGNCRASMRNYFHNMETHQCEEFIYGGCGGNGNNFQTKQECEQTCDHAVICGLESETGNCRAAHTRYFFKSSTEKCDTFVYSGCGGNANNFDTVDACMKSCKTTDGNNTGNKVEMKKRSDFRVQMENGSPEINFSLFLSVITVILSLFL